MEEASKYINIISFTEKGEALAKLETSQLSWKPCRHAKGSPFGRAAERSEAERASSSPAAPPLP